MCGKRFKPQEHHLNRGREKSYCDMTCYANDKGNYTINEEGERTHKACAGCEEIFPIGEYVGNGITKKEILESLHIVKHVVI